MSLYEITHFCPPASLRLNAL